MIARLMVNATPGKRPPLQIRSFIFKNLALICPCLWLSSLLHESILQMWPAGIKCSFPSSCLSEENKGSALVHIAHWWAHQTQCYAVCLFTVSCACEKNELRWQLKKNKKKTTLTAWACFYGEKRLVSSLSVFKTSWGTIRYIYNELWHC